MNALSELEPLEYEELRVEPRPDDGTLHFDGIASMRSPMEVLGPYLKKVHQAASQSEEIEELTLDIRELRFMNSSCIRVLIDWIEWIRSEPEARQYVLHFRSSPRVPWQRTTLTALQVMSAELVKVTKD
jgi:hypothetical protein